MNDGAKRALQCADLALLETNEGLHGSVQLLALEAFLSKTLAPWCQGATGSMSAQKLDDERNA